MGENNMSEDEYLSEIKALLKRFESSYDFPSGFLEDGLAFSCDVNPIIVPNPSTLSPEQRQVLINKLHKRYPKT
jgi:hypothetical protein